MHWELKSLGSALLSQAEKTKYLGMHVVRRLPWRKKSTWIYNSENVVGNSRELQTQSRKYTLLFKIIIKIIGNGKRELKMRFED